MQRSTTRKITRLLNDFNKKIAAIARALKTFDVGTTERGTTHLLLRDAYPGISGRMVFPDVIDETEVALLKDYLQIQTLVRAGSGYCPQLRME